jgi:DSF synthase
MDNSPRKYETIELKFEPDKELLWLIMRHPVRPNCTFELLQDTLDAFRWMQNMFSLNIRVSGTAPFKYLISASALPGVFNYGGDLSVFVDLVQKHDRRELLHYARLCIDAQFVVFNSLELPIITIAFLEGDALGGGFEYALMHDIVLAKEDVKLGFPESQFNSFPGMGAYSVVGRRLARKDIETILTGGKLFQPEEMLKFGLLDKVVSKQEGRGEVYAYLKELDEQFNSRLGHYRSLRKVHPLGKTELLEISELWVDAALNLRTKDLRRMQLLAHAQSKRK